MRRPDWYIKQLRERVSIADYAGKRLTWDRRKSRPAAGDYWAPCPFHTEKSASFHVREREGSFKCFGCGEGGDVFKLCQKLEGLDFVGAIDKLAAEAGMPPPETTPQAQAAHDARGRLMRIVAAAHGLYRKTLLGPEGAPVRAYLEGRGLGPDAWDQFGIGYAPDQWTFALDALGKDGVRREDMIAAGLAREGGRSGAIDLFRHRVMFPIADAQGRVIAFGGRTLSADKDTPKYVNSPESEVYHKGRVLYRLKEARETLARNRKADGADGFVVAEGYLDVAAFERAGVAAVAPLGTALTDDQLQLAWKSGGAPILCFDGDSAGLRAADRALDTALPHLGPSRTVRIVMLPAGLDPDDVFRTSGPEALKALLATAIPADEALFLREKGRRPLDTPEARADLQKRLKDVAARIADPDTRRQYDRAFNDRYYALVRTAPRAPFVKGARAARGQEPPATPTPELRALAQIQRSSQLEGMVRLAADHPYVLRAGADVFASLPIADRDHDLIRHAILDLWAASKPVDRAAISHHLLSAGHQGAAGAVLRWPPPVGAKRREGAPETPPPEEEAQKIEAEWLAFLTLDVTSPQVVKEIDEARQRNLDTDLEAFKAALAATKARHNLHGAAIARGSADFDPDAKPGPAPDDRVL